MDLNLLYSRHQISLIHATSSSDEETRARHLNEAGEYARQIRQFRLSFIRGENAQ